jgi:hypothetical protein
VKRIKQVFMYCSLLSANVEGRKKGHAMGIVLGILLILWGWAASACPKPDARHPSQHLAALNAVRAQAVVLVSVLGAQAQAQASDMGLRRYVSHTSPAGEGMVWRFRRAGLSEMYRGAENIAKGQQKVASMMQSWMDSEGHRRNLLDPRLTHVGFGRGPRQAWVQVFAGRC